jgi:ankyrin repeat protein
LLPPLVRLIVQQGRIELHQSLPGVEPPLHKAIKASNFAAVQLFLALGAPLHLCNAAPPGGSDLGTLALSCAVLRQFDEKPRRQAATAVIATLLAHVARLAPSLINADQGNLLTVLCGNDSGYMSTDPHEAAELFLLAGFKPTMSSPVTGSFPLHLAAAQGHWRTSIALLSHGADINAVDRQGKTAFEHANDRGELRNEMRAVLRSAQMSNILFNK